MISLAVIELFLLLSYLQLHIDTEKYPSGRRGGFAKALGGLNRARVRLPPSPPKNRNLSKKREIVFEMGFVLMRLRTVYIF